MSELEPTRTCSDPTANDILRRLLDERGVEHYEHEAPAADCVAFFDGNGWHDCWDSVDGEVNVTFSMTPEQAIAATLGATDAKPTQAESSGTCHITDNGPWGYPYVYSACGASFDPDVNNGEFNHCPNCGRRIEQ